MSLTDPKWQKMRTFLLHHLMLPRYLLKPSILCSPHSSLILFFYQTPPRKMSPQEQRYNNSPVEEDLVNTDTQTIDSPARQTIDGKKFICSFYPSIAIINWKSSWCLQTLASKAQSQFNRMLKRMLRHHRLFLLLSLDLFQKNIVGARTLPATLGTPRCSDIASYVGYSSALEFFVLGY